MSQHAFAVSFAIDRVDRAAGVIRGVAVITEGIANGLVVDALTLKQIKECSESYANGLKVVDRHTKGTDSVFSTVGFLRNFRIDGQKLVADLFTLKSEANTAKLMEMAETIPDTFGLSVAFSGPNEDRDGASFARCVEIYNAALVDVPAANPTGLFSDAQAGAAAVAMVKPVDAPRNGKAQTAPQTNMADNNQPDFEARFKALEDAVAEMSKKMSCIGGDAEKAEMSEVKKTVTELSAKLDTATKELSAKVGDRDALAQVIAKEFSRHIGGTAPAGAAPAGGGGDNGAASKADQFIECAKKHFAATKNKATATKLAIAEAPELYRAFRDSGKDIKWA